MKRTLFIILLLLACISIAQANRLDVLGDKVIAETDNYTVHFQNGTLTYLHNKLTNETYTTQEQAHPIGGVVLAGKLGRGDETIIFADKFRSEKIDDLTVHMIFESHLGVKLTNVISIDAETGDLIVQQNAMSERPSLSEVVWGINNVKDDIELILPSNNGIAVDKHSRARANLKYPSWSWQAQLVICQGHHGGFFVRAEDADFRYKSFNYERDNNIYLLQFTFYNDAPFDDLKTIQTVPWRLNTYSGGWRVPARQYRDWMENTFRPHQPPDWVNKINCFFTVANDTNLIRGLVEHGIEPEKTLLVTGALDPAIDPATGTEYTIKPHYAETVEFAHKLGFKIMATVNFLGVFAQDTAIFNQFKKDQLLNPESGEGYAHGTPDFEDHHIFVNPASAEYREHFVRQLRRIYDAAPCDGFFLDVNHIAVNHAHGKIDGLRMPQGSIHLHQELREAMPGILFIGEGVHEMTYSQVHFSGHLGGRVDSKPHPIYVFLFDNYVKSFARMQRDHSYTITETPERLEIYKARGILPENALWHPTLLHSPELQKRLAVFKEWQRLSPQINLESDVPYQPSWVDLYLMPTIYIRGDVNRDGIVNILDLVLVANHLGTKDSRYDLNYDFVVDILDLVIVSQEMRSQ